MSGTHHTAKHFLLERGSFSRDAELSTVIGRSDRENAPGIPEYRTAKPYIYVIYKDPKDNSCQVGALYMRESYSGAGTYGSPYLGGIRDVQYIDCAVVK